MQLTSIGRLRLVTFLAVGVIAGSSLVYGCSDDDDKTTTPTKTDSGASETSTGTDSGGGGDTGTKTDTGTTTDSGPTTVTAVANITDTSGGAGVSGTATFTQTGTGPVTVNISISGAAPDGMHGIHIHANGDCGNGDGGAPGSGAGGHWNIVDGGTHGYPDAATHHIGDMGNINIAGGTGTLMLTSTEWTIDPTANANSVVGHAVIFHAGTDDGTTQPTGDAGARPGCGIIQKQ